MTLFLCHNFSLSNVIYDYRDKPFIYYLTKIIRNVKSLMILGKYDNQIFVIQMNLVTKHFFGNYIEYCCKGLCYMKRN